jgi:hypothetical protein
MKNHLNIVGGKTELRRLKGKSAIAMALAAVCGLAGCESTPHTYLGPESKWYRQTERIERVWIADDFDFGNYNAIFVVETAQETAAPEDKHQEEFQNSLRGIQRELCQAIELKQIVPKVVTNQAALHAEDKTLKLQTTLYEFHPADVAMRIMFGAYGAGKATVKVRGRLSDMATDKSLLLIEDESNSEMIGSIRSGATDAVLNMAVDWAKLFSKVRKKEPIDYKD